MNVPQWVCCSTVTVFYAYIAKCGAWIRHVALLAAVCKSREKCDSHEINVFSAGLSKNSLVSMYSVHTCNTDRHIRRCTMCALVENVRTSCSALLDCKIIHGKLNISWSGCGLSFLAFTSILDEFWWVWLVDWVTKMYENERKYRNLVGCINSVRYIARTRSFCQSQ